MVKIVDLKDPTGTGAPGWWAAKCLICGEWATKFDETPEQARAFAQEHLDEHGASTLF